MKSCLVLGGAQSVWTDAANALCLAEYDLTIAINDMGTRWSDPIDIWCTLHPDKMTGWRADRKRAGYAGAGLHVGHKPWAGVDRGIEYKFEGQPSSGSSGLFAVKLAMDEDCDRIVLAGVPMSPELGHIGGDTRWAECSSYRPAWEWAKSIFDGRVKSMSGWTREALGAPDSEWFAGLFATAVRG